MGGGGCTAGGGDGRLATQRAEPWVVVVQAVAKEERIRARVEFEPLVRGEMRVRLHHGISDGAEG